MKVIIRKRKISTIPLLEIVNEEDKNKALALIVYYHGWRINKELIMTQARKLAQKGFRVVLPDAENHGERIQDVSAIPSLTFFNSIHTNLFEFDYILNYFKERNLLKGKVGVGGLSMGAMTTCALLTQHPEIDAAASLMGTPSLTRYRNRIEKHASELEFFLPSDYHSLTSWMENYDLSLHPDSLGQRPLFIWHGNQDKKVPISHSIDFIEANPELNIENHFDDSGHLVTTEIMDKVTDFFVKHLL